MGLLSRWAHGYCITRHYKAPEPIHADSWLRFDVGKPEQMERYIYLGDDPQAFAEVLAGIEMPFIHLDMAIEQSRLKPVLPAKWVFRYPAYMMTRKMSEPVSDVLDEGIHIVGDGPRFECIAHAADGRTAARGVVGIYDGVAVFDQIMTETEFRRQGFGSRVMASLQAVAASSGAREQLLIATGEGRALYRALGWSVVTEITSVSSVPETL